MKSSKKSDRVKVCKGDVCVEADGTAGRVIKALVIGTLAVGLYNAAKTYLN